MEQTPGYKGNYGVHGTKWSDVIRYVDTQTQIIKLQSDVIDELFILLMQHITVEETDRLPVLEKINLAAELRESLDGSVNYG